MHLAQFGDKTYSVDMMFAYINIFKPKSVKLNLNEVDYNLDNLSWNGVSPNEVLDKPDLYPEDYNKIIKADLRYPIILDKDHSIFDGVHRYVKAVLLNKPYVRAYVFDDDLLDKFVINEQNQMHQFIELFWNNFSN